MFNLESTVFIQRSFTNVIQCLWFIDSQDCTIAILLTLGNCVRLDKDEEVLS